MCVEEAKKIFSGDVTAFSPKILQEAAKIILSELGKAEKKIFELERNNCELKEKNNWFNLEDLPGEIWKNITGYEGIYQISNKGRVKSFKNKKPRILRCSDIDGYREIQLYNNGEKNRKTVHRLVAIHFIPNPENKPEVNHKNGIRNDNRIENLEWVTHEENMLHAYRNGLNKHRNRKITYDLACHIREVYKAWDKNFGMSALAKKYNLNLNLVKKIIYNQTYKHPN